MPKKQFILRLDPEDPEDANLIALLVDAKSSWGGVQQVLRDALSRYSLDDSGDDSGNSSSAREANAAYLADAIREINPGITSDASIAMAMSEPLGKMYALYGAFSVLTPNTLMEIDALLLRLLQRRIDDILHEAVDQRQPIRQILKE